jgi:hypothetical protein
VRLSVPLTPFFVKDAMKGPIREMKKLGGKDEEQQKQ